MTVEPPAESKIVLPVVVRRNDQWVPKQHGRGGRYGKFYVATYPVASRRFSDGFEGGGATPTKAKADLTDAIMQVLDGFDEPEFLELLGYVGIVCCRPAERGGISWGYRIVGPEGLHGVQGWTCRERNETKLSCVRHLTQYVCGVDFWDPRRIKTAAEFAEKHGVPAREIHRDAAAQRGMAYAASIGEADPHSWMQFRLDEFIDRWDRPT